MVFEWSFNDARVAASCHEGDVLVLDFYGDVTSDVMEAFAAMRPRVLADACPLSRALLVCFVKARLLLSAGQLTHPMVAPANDDELFAPAALVGRRQDRALLRAHCAEAVDLGIVREVFTNRGDGLAWASAKAASARAASRPGRQ